MAGQIRKALAYIKRTYTQRRHGDYANGGVLYPQVRVYLGDQDITHLVARATDMGRRA